MTAYILVTGLALLVASTLFGVFIWGAIRHAIAITLTAVFLVAGTGVSFATWSIGTAIDRNITLQYKEYWNGFELSAEEKSITCRKNGRCKHTFQCDPEQVPVTTTDSEGNTTTTMKTEWQSCPYTTEETTYSVNTTLGDFVYARNVPTGSQYRIGHRIPSRLETSPPKEWVAAKQRLEKGEPRGVTSINNYDNYLLGSDSEMQKRYAGDVDTLLEQELLPELGTNVFEHYRANKVHTVNYKPKHDFFEDVENINGALGVDNKQGDLHVVFVGDSANVNPDTYGNALMAYWQGKDFKRHALAKNAIVVVMGVDESTNTVSWARGYTGMPVGNAGFTTAVMSRMPGLPVDSELLGRPSYDTKTETIKHSDGALETILWDSTAGFERVSMTGNDEDDVGSGFTHLKHSIKTSTAAIVIMTILNVGFLALLLMGSRRVVSSFSYRRQSW